MKIKEARQLFEADVIEGFNAYRSPAKPDEWLIRIEFEPVVNGDISKPVFLTNSHGDNKVFKRLNTLVKEIESITGSFYTQLLISGNDSAQGDLF